MEVEAARALRGRIRSRRRRMRVRPAAAVSRLLRAPHLHGAARQARRARRPVRESHRGHLRAARHYQRRLLDSSAGRSGAGHQRREHIYLHPRIPVEGRARQAPHRSPRRSGVWPSRHHAGAKSGQADREGAQHRHGAERQLYGNQDHAVKRSCDPVRATDDRSWARVRSYATGTAIDRCVWRTRARTRR